jgi:hypothetical protein
MTRFADWSHEEYKAHALGYRPQLRNASRVTELGAKPFRYEHSKTPKSVDWRKENAVTEVKNQMQVIPNSTAGFSSSGVFCCRKRALPCSTDHFGGFCSRVQVLATCRPALAVEKGHLSTAASVWLPFSIALPICPFPFLSSPRLQVHLCTSLQTHPPLGRVQPWTGATPGRCTSVPPVAISGCHQCGACESYGPRRSPKCAMAPTLLGVDGLNPRLPSALGLQPCEAALPQG